MRMAGWLAVATSGLFQNSRPGSEQPLLFVPAGSDLARTDCHFICDFPNGCFGWDPAQTAMTSAFWQPWCATLRVGEVFVHVPGAACVCPCVGDEMFVHVNFYDVLGSGTQSSLSPTHFAGLEDVKHELQAFCHQLLIVFFLLDRAEVPQEALHHRVP